MILFESQKLSGDFILSIWVYPVLSQITILRFDELGKDWIYLLLIN
jgi:hypothetical protein